NVIHDDHALRRLEASDALRLEPPSALGEVECGVGGDHDECHHLLTEAFVRNTDRHRLAYRGVGLENAFDLADRDVLTTADDDVLESSGDGEPPILEPSDIAGAEPSVVGERLGRADGIAV